MRTISSADCRTPLQVHARARIERAATCGGAIDVAPGQDGARIEKVGALVSDPPTIWSAATLSAVLADKNAAAQ